MADEKVYYPETIEDAPLPGQILPLDLSSSTPSEAGGVTGAEKIKDQKPVSRYIPHDVVGVTLNTLNRRILQEFQFTESGALSIGAYKNGVSGDIRLTPNGITARDSAGINTFSIDATTGNAAFKGTLQAGTLIGADNKVFIEEVDGHGRIIVADNENTPRILIGYQKDGF